MSGDPSGQPSTPALSPQQQQLVLEHARLVQRAVRRYSRRFRGLVSEDDLRQSAQLGLTEAAAGYRAELGYPFAGYAWRYACGRIMRAAKRETRQREHTRRAVTACIALQSPKLEPATASDEEAGAALASHTERAVMAYLLGFASQAAHEAATMVGADALSRERVYRAIRDALGQLDGAKRRIVELYYFDGVELRAAASELGVSYATARRYHDAALDFLYARLATA